MRGAGCPIYAMDSDGSVGQLIPVWIEAGINVCDPMEVAAGNDLVELRSAFGRKMAYRGGVDKRAIASGGDAIEREIERLSPIIENGGYIPGCEAARRADGVVVVRTPPAGAALDVHPRHGTEVGGTEAREAPGPAEARAPALVSRDTPTYWITSSASISTT